MEDPEIRTLAKAVEKYLTPGWRVQFDENRTFFTRGEMKFSFNRDKGRVNIETWTWPQYMEYRNQDSLRQTVSPSSVYPRETSPSISCAIARGADAIAREITRRFLPEYERIWQLCAAQAKEHGDYNVKARDGWQAVCKAVGSDPKHGHAYFDGAGVHVRIENRQGSCRVEIDAKPERVIELVALLKGAE